MRPVALARMLVADIKGRRILEATKISTSAPSDDRNLSLPEAAERLGVSPHLIRRWMARREIPFIKLGRRVVFALKDLEALEARRRVEARSSSRPQATTR